MKSLVENLNDSPVTTILMAVAFTVIVIVGGIITIVNPDSLSFDRYITSVGIAAGALGLLGIGRGINAGQKKIAEAATVNAAYEAGVEYEEPPEAPTEEELESAGEGPIEIEIIEGEGPPEVEPAPRTTLSGSHPHVEPPPEPVPPPTPPAPPPDPAIPPEQSDLPPDTPPRRRRKP